MHWIIDLLIQIAVAIAFAFGFGLLMLKVIGSKADAGIFKWSFVALLNIFVGYLIYSLNEGFVDAQSGLTVEYYQYELDGNLMNQISLISSVFFFVVSWAMVLLWDSSADTVFKRVGISFVASLIISIIVLNVSENRLSAQANSFAIKDVEALCEIAQTSLDKMDLAIKSNSDFSSIYSDIRSGSENLSYAASQISYASPFLTDFSDRMMADWLAEYLVSLEESADSVFIDKVVSDSDYSFEDDPRSYNWFKEDLSCAS
jgi:hypothetical protein